MTAPAAIPFIINFSKIGYAAPGIVIAIGVISPSIFVDKQINQFFSYFGKDIGLIFSGSVTILVFAYLVRFLSVAFNPIESGLEKVSEKKSNSPADLINLVKNTYNSEKMIEKIIVKIL